MKKPKLRNSQLLLGLARCAVVIVLLLVLRPVAHALQVGYWLAEATHAQQAGDSQRANRLVSHAKDYGASAERLTSFQSQPTPRPAWVPSMADERAHLLAEIERTGWTDATRGHYARLLDPTDDIQAIGYLLGEVEELSIDDKGVLRLIAENALQRQDWEAVRASIQKILSLDPQDSWANYQLGLLLAIDDPASATNYLTAVATNPTYASDATRINQLVTTRNAEDMATYFRSLGLALVDIQAWFYAEHAFDSSLALDGVDWFSFAYRGYVRDKHGGDGLNDLETSVGLAPNTALPYYFLGLHYRDTTPQDFTKAHDAFATAFLLEPRNPAFAVEIAQTYQFQSQYELAAEWYAIAISNDPSNSQWASLQAAFYADSEYLLDEEGLGLIEDAYRLAPQDASILASLGRAYYVKNDFTQARQYLEEAVQRDPNDPRARYYFATLLAREGDTVAARANFEKVIELAGDQSTYGTLAVRVLAQLP